MKKEKELKKEKKGFNPYLPSWEYIPDGEPYVFDGRVYVYGSHDRFNGHAYCLNDYVCWSAPEDDLTEWKYEGIIYYKTDDPENRDGEMCLYAPDVGKGPDGRYYLYYVLDQLGTVSVAVSDIPAGKYEYYGVVQYPDGTKLGEKEGDEPQFDPGLLVEGNDIYLYTGFCYWENESRTGAMVTVLEPDMLTVRKAPRFVVPSVFHSKGSGFEGHEFFEASSIRKVGNSYYFIYSSILQHELCYAVSESPIVGFVFKGTIVSNNDTGISSYKPREKPAFYGGNNHGSIVKIGGEWYVFYHRHTNGTNYSRQGCMEKIEILEDGSIPQVEMTSCGSNGGALPGEGEYPAYIACNLYCQEELAYTGSPGEWLDCRFPKITQDGYEIDAENGYITNMRNGAVAGYKYFDCKGIYQIAVTVRGNCRGGCYDVMTDFEGICLGQILITSSNEWKTYKADIAIPDGIRAIYLRYKGNGYASLKSFELIKR